MQDFFGARVFEEPLIPVGGEPTAAENKELASALIGFSRRSGPDDFSSLTAFLETHPSSPWAAALLTDLGLEYYHTAHYSLALEAWKQAWLSGKDATDLKGKAIADRAVGELAYMYARLGRMSELEALLKSVKNRSVVGAATERLTGAREGLWNMEHRPEIAFRCGPLALRCIRLATHVRSPGDVEILKSASTQKGCSLPQVADLSKKVGLNYQMAFRGQGAVFVVPSVVHWKVGHYAALLRKEGDRYQLQDPTFGDETWATQEALESETSGYFLVPPGPLPAGWRKVAEDEGSSVWGKGNTAHNDKRRIATTDKKTSKQKCRAMAVVSIHLLDVNLNLSDEPVGYSSPVGPPVRFTVRYNYRDAFQPANFDYSNLGSKWTSDWIAYITDSPSNRLASVNLYLQGGGQRTFAGFDTNTQTYAYQSFDQTLLHRTGPSSYELLSGDGSKLVFGQSDGSQGATRNLWLTQAIDPAGNAVTLTYDDDLRITAITDAIGQVTTLTYGLPDDRYKLTQVTDPFGRSATFQYDDQFRLVKITDVIGLTSQFVYLDYPAAPPLTGTVHTDFIQQLVTPYGTNSFLSADDGNTRFLGITYPDNSREIVEYTQTNSAEFGPLGADPLPTVPLGMSTFNQYLNDRNTYYWSRTACALGYPDFTKARLFHWLHTADLESSSGDLESAKEPLEGRVWYDYPGQPEAYAEGSANRPTHVGRVLDDGSTQLFTYAYNAFGHVTNMIDPAGRAFSYLYASNGVDLLEVRQTRAGNNQLLFKATYNSQHLPLSRTDASGQTTTYTYNPRGQLLTETDPKNQTTTYSYDTNGYRLAVVGPLGANDSIIATYDAFGRMRTKTDQSGYTVTLDYDALDRLTTVTFPDGTFSQITYNRLDPVVLRDRAGRQTLLDYDNMRQVRRRTDPLNRTTSFQWCSCGDLKSVTDPMGRATAWDKDVQGRLTSKKFADGSAITYLYEKSTSRVQQTIDERQQITQLAYNGDNAVRSVSYPNAAVPTPPVYFTYDPDFVRPLSMTDGIGTTTYAYNPIASPPALGAGQLASIDGPLANDTVTYTYDELGRRTQTAINGVAATRTFDAEGRVSAESNALGSFTFTYDGSTSRLTSESFPNGLAGTRSYLDNLHDDVLQQIAYAVGASRVSQFNYGHDIPAERITTWSQQAGTQPASIYNFNYDAADQLLSASVTNAGTLAAWFAYSYDPAGNRLAEVAGGATNAAAYNALNQLSASSYGAGLSRSNEWDAAGRLAAVNAGNRRTEFAYDGLGRLASIRQLANGSEVSYRRLLWCGNTLCEERDSSGASVTKRYYPEGVKMETGPTPGAYFYTRDHLGSIRELTDAAAASVRAIRTILMAGGPGWRATWTPTLDSPACFGPPRPPWMSPDSGPTIPNWDAGFPVIPSMMLRPQKAPISTFTSRTTP